MKYPKLWDAGASPVGEGNIRALERTDAPYLTAIGPDSISYKRPGFNEVHTKNDELKFPYLWGTYVVAGSTPTTHVVWTALFSPEDNVARTTGYTRTYTMGVVNTDACMCKVFVGDDYVLRLLSDAAATGGVEVDSTIFWPSIVRAVNLGAEYLSTEEGHERHSITYIDTVQFGGMTRLIHNPHLFATGWDNDATRYRFGITYLVQTLDEFDVVTALSPTCWIGNTGDYSLVQQAFPYYPGRFHLPFTTNCVGHGKLRSVQFIDDNDDALPRLNPFIADSTDHGVTWTAAEHSWLTALLGLESGGSRDSYIYNQQFFMSRSSLSVYLGDNKSFLYLGNALSGGNFAPALFLESGGAYTRVAWPPDTWYVDVSGAKPGALNVGRWLSLMFPTELDSAQMSFGVGCFYVGMFDDGVPKILYTHDFGTTWAISPQIPAHIYSANYKIVGTMIKPYITQLTDVDGNITRKGDMGRMVFAAPDYTANKLRFYFTDGNFTKWIYIGNIVKPRGDLISFNDENHYFVNFGGQKYRPQVFPAFPDEFMKPKAVVAP